VQVGDLSEPKKKTSENNYLIFPHQAEDEGEQKEIWRNLLELQTKEKSKGNAVDGLGAS